MKEGPKKENYRLMNSQSFFHMDNMHIRSEKGEKGFEKDILYKT